MRVCRPLRVLLLLAPALLLAGMGADAQERRPGERRPPPKKPATPARPTPDKPTPDKPTPDKPTPDKPTPNKPTPDKPAPEKPAPSAPETTAQARAKALARAIAAQEKSEKAGTVFQKFIEGTPEERVKAVAEPAKYGPQAAKYFESSPNRDFKPLGIQILGTVSSPSQPDRLFFPYFVATDKNRRGFVTVVLETADGFRVDWNSFYRGHDFNLETFLTDKKPGSTIVYLVGISKTHIFGEGPPGGEAKNLAYAIEMPPGPPEEDPVKAFVDKESEVGKLMGEKLTWSRGHLCWLTLTFEGTSPYLKIKAYQPYAK